MRFTDDVLLETLNQRLDGSLLLEQHLKSSSSPGRYRSHGPIVPTSFAR
jgi:hypothetical protein